MEAKKNKKRQQPLISIASLTEKAGITEEYLQECEERHRKRGTPFSRDILFGPTSHKKPTS